MGESNKDRNGTHEHASGAGASVQKECDEDVLVAWLRAGSRDALAALYLLYYPEMVVLARSFVHYSGSAEDIVQDTWAAVIEGLGRFEGKCSFKTWVFRILANKAKKRHRRDSRLSAIKRLLGVGATGDRPSSFDSRGSWAKPVERWLESPEQMLLSKELHREMDKFMASLPVRQCQVFVLRNIEGWPAEKVCEKLGLSAGNQRVLLHRARTAIYRWCNSKIRKGA